MCAARGAPIVVKADGLAAGKGVVVAATVAEALAAVDGAATGALVIEECLEGEEASLFALCDGTTALEIGTAQDHKRALRRRPRAEHRRHGCLLAGAAAGRRPWSSGSMAEIVRPTLAGMAAEGAPFTGILYAGLMLTAAGPKLIEYNVRFGDPECQVVLPRLMTDLAQLLLGAVDGMLGHMDLRWLPVHALTRGAWRPRAIPAPTRAAARSAGSRRWRATPDLLLFHAGTERDADGRLLADGRAGAERHRPGRARWPRRGERAYAAVDRIDWPEGFCRRDIGWRALAG